jgi:cytochrome c peroxidase
MMRIVLGAIMMGLLFGCTASYKPESVKASAGNPQSLSAIEQLGKNLYFDASLSEPPGQSCATCHDPAVGWTGPKPEINRSGGVYPGAVHSRFGNRKPPSAAYATQSPPLYFDNEEGIFIGGNFWDGRATGWLLGQPAAEQAQGPFLNPVEQNLPNAETVVKKVCDSSYGHQFRAFFGKDICANVVNAYNAIGQAIFAFENSAELNAFSSKYDHYLRDPVKYPLTDQELLGLRLFEDDDKGKCSECHPSVPGAAGAPPLFTDYSYDNLGLPKNLENPTYRMPREFNPAGTAWIDPGLGGFLAGVPRFAHLADQNQGLHKVPTLRNVDKRPGVEFVKAFGHNGVFKSLKEIVHFYNTRDVLPACEATAGAKPGLNCWEKPEVVANLNTGELGNLGLTEEEEWALVAFMQTLSDGWAPE